MITKRIKFLFAILAVLLTAQIFQAQAAGQSRLKATEQLQQGTGSDKWAKLEGFHHNPEDNPVFQVLALAEESIDIEIYKMADPDIHAMLRKAINRKPDPIRVRIIKDPNTAGELCRYFEPISSKDTEDCQDQKNLVAEIRASPGGEFVPFNGKKLCKGRNKKGRPKNCFQHGKLILIDGKHALLSTGNFDITSSCNLKRNPKVCNRDFSYITSDPEVVKTLSEIFENDLAGEWYDLETYFTESISGKLTISPFSLEPLVAFINRAQKSIRIVNQYLKEKTINDALKDKAAENIKIQAMVASLCSSGKPKNKRSAMALFGGFDDSGIPIRMFTSSMKVRGQPGYLHAKAIVIDDVYAWIGSINGSELAVSANREFGIFFDRPADVKRLIKILDADYSAPESETWEESLACKKDCFPFVSED
ncbi:MAG: hypothetical protein HY796_12425 [Elusimicrobia bacterium]|nr:hypothetical protein [Elusimicrobiota bacterium]